MNMFLRIDSQAYIRERYPWVLERAMVFAQAIGTELPSQASRSLQLGHLSQRNSDSLSYAWLVNFWRRSLRRRNWSMLSMAEKGLFRCALWVAKARGRISNTRLIVQVLRIALKLLENFKSRVGKAGRERAMVMLEEYAKPGGVFSWAPQMREWLHNPRYVWYLGVMEVSR